MPAPAIPAVWSAAVSPLLDAIEERRRSTALVGLFGSAKGLVLSALAGRLADRKTSVLVVTPTDEAAERLHADVAFFHRLQGAAPDDVLLFPDWGVLPYASAPPVEVIGQRMRVLDRLRGADRGLALIVPVTAFLQRLLPRSLFAEACFSLQQADTIERAHLVTRLLRLGYRRVSVVENPGEFAVRGGIVDLFSTAHEEPRRLEFLGDTIETIRLFDPATQKSSGRAPSLRILPARELIRPEPPASNEAAEPLPPDAEWRGPSVYPTMDTLLDYFAAPPVLIADEPADLRKHAEDFQVEARAAYGGLKPSTPSLPPPEELFLPLSHLLEAGGSRSLITITAIPSGETDGMSDAGPVLRFEAHRPQAAGIGVKGRSFTETLTHLETLRVQGPVVIVARSRGQVDRRKALFLEHDLPAEPLGDKPVTTLGAHAPYVLVQGELSGGLLGLRGPGVGAAPLDLYIIAVDELFAKGGQHKAPSLAKSAAFLKSLEEVKVGDYVVHVQHGIGRYSGLRRLAVQGFDSDYLIVEYAGGDMVYVPLDRLSQIQRYSPSEGQVPKLSHLGGTAWSRTKARVRQSIEEMAKDLIAVHATRQTRGRPAFSPDSMLSHEFDAAFEYEETADQFRAIEDIRRDMESDKPMDRLICGDVGYGKTEVAIRAAFKAVQDNRQAAVLVPTTLLAQQHFETFTERFAPFPVTVGVVSRLQSSKDLKATLRGVAQGSIDIIIGTHRLLQKDVQFRNLGLVVIDEEQWFGVRHKERLKQLRTQVDVLTLTATPIPRTLQMALSGLRDLSTIETPPPDRLAIRTQLCRFGTGIIREAILRELGRGGQVFFVHNRVQDIERMGAWLKELVPAARIVVAHGQMDPRPLEATMLKFHRREADVLLSTTIIESGLDIPSANTILVNRADTFGLAQLYQIRGRVGRSRERAYAYLLVPARRPKTLDAQKRLAVLQQFTELGAGFQIASHDLEMRGAGNLLGPDQSGTIAAVGFDLYTQLMEEAVRELRGEAPRQEFEPDVELPLPALIPEEYVPDVAHRLSLYKRMTASAQMGDLAHLHGELVDRYGAPPEPVERLFEVMELRLLAKALRVAAIQVRPTVVAFSFDEKALPPQAGLQALMDENRARLRFTTPHSFELLGVDSEWKAVFPEIKRVLHVLASYGKKPIASA